MSTTLISLVPVVSLYIMRNTLRQNHVMESEEFLMKNTKNFDKLSTESKLKVLNYEDNFIGLSKSANASKGMIDGLAGK